MKVGHIVDEQEPVDIAAEVISVTLSLPPFETQTLKLVPALLTVMLSFAVALTAGLSESVTCTVKEVVPVAVGVPDRVPALEFSVSPGGNAALEMLQV